MPANIIKIESLDSEGRGVGHLSNEDGSLGKVIFVEGALPKEIVQFKSFRKKKKWELARIVSLQKESSLRVEPSCSNFGICGGCSMQHLDSSAQVAVKQRVLEDNLKHIGRVKPERILPPIHGPYWGYRFRARLAVNDVQKKGGVLVGFHEKQSRYITDMKKCLVLPSHISEMLVPLRELIGSLSIRQKVPQIEVAIGGDKNKLITALVLRIMAPLTSEDEMKLKSFSDQYGVQWWLQTKGLDTIVLFYPIKDELKYYLSEFKIEMPFKPGDFTQVNHYINDVMVSRAVRLLEIDKNDRVADLFCGLGNFSLPMARQAREVIGIEGSQILTQRAQESALLNQLQNKTKFSTFNLFELTVDDWVVQGSFDKILIDPPRDGAMAVCQAIADLNNNQTIYRPKRIVYISCNPATLARDAGILVSQNQYRLKMAGVVNMFPHTSHVESMAVFDRVD